jgi:hypothetical protein
MQKSRKRKTKGSVKFGAFATCGCCSGHTIISNLFLSGESVITYLLESGWTRDKRGWVCSQCNYEHEKAEKAKVAKASGEIPF